MGPVGVSFPKNPRDPMDPMVLWYCGTMVLCTIIQYGTVPVLYGTVIRSELQKNGTVRYGTVHCTLMFTIRYGTVVRRLHLLRAFAN